METSVVRLPGADLRAARRHAIVYVLSASATFTLGSALVKALTVDFPVLEIVLFRGVVGFLAMLPMIARSGGLAALKTRRPVGHVMRTVYGFVGTVTSVYGFGVLPLVTVTALGFAMPLFLTILSVPLLGERVGPRRATAVLVGLCGVLVMLRPWHVDADSMPVGAVLIVMSGVVTWSLSMINIRPMGDAGEKNVTIVAWYSLGTASLAAFGCVGGWGDPEPAAAGDAGERRAAVRPGATADDRRLPCGRDDAGGAVRIRRDHLRDRARHRDLGRVAGCLEPDRGRGADRVGAVHLAPGGHARDTTVGRGIRVWRAATDDVGSRRKRGS
jgi:drug/metabolite transporter (DMT)-like permease